MIDSRKIKQWGGKEFLMNQKTKKLIDKYSPMWTNKQIWEFDQLNEELSFDLVYVEPGNYDESLWKSKSSFPDSYIRDVVVKNFDYMVDGKELWIANKGKGLLDEQYFAYLMAVITDVMIEEEVCLNFRIEKNCLITTIDRDADVIDCKEFFEEFYHLATGFNYDTDTGIPDDETEAEMYLTRLQEEFDEKMKLKLGSNYLSSNNDPDTLNSK